MRVLTDDRYEVQLSRKVKGGDVDALETLIARHESDDLVPFNLFCARRGISLALIEELTGRPVVEVILNHLQAFSGIYSRGYEPDCGDGIFASLHSIRHDAFYKAICEVNIRERVRFMIETPDAKKVAEYLSHDFQTRLWSPYFDALNVTQNVIDIFRSSNPGTVLFPDIKFSTPNRIS